MRRVRCARLEDCINGESDQRFASGIVSDLISLGRAWCCHRPMQGHEMTATLV